MKRELIGIALCAGAAVAVAGTPTIDGTIELAQYGAAAATQTEPNSFGGGHALEAMYVTSDANNVYIALEGNSSFNNAITVFVDINNVTGDSATPLPAANGGGGAANGQAGSTFDIPEVDFAFSMNSGDNNNSTNEGGNDASAYLDAVDYTDDSGTPNDADYLGADAVVDSANDTSNLSGTFDTTFGSGSVTFAYSDGDAAGAGTGLRGLEISIPRSILGATSTSTATFFATFTNGGGTFYSSQVLPSATGQGAVNLGAAPVNFTSVAGTQNTASPSPMPVSVSTFTID